MHFELPKLPLHGAKDFAKHYLMIVLSILTALGLEAWIEHAHHRQAARLASQQIQAELRRNLASVHQAYASNQRRLGALRKLDQTITQDVRSGADTATVNRHIQTLKHDFILSLNWPAFANQAWDVAVANQSATWMDNAALNRYAAAYTRQRDAASWMTNNSTLLLNAPLMSAMRTRIDLGSAVDPVDYLAMLREMIHTTEETQSHLLQAADDLQRSVDASARDVRDRRQ